MVCLAMISGIVCSERYNVWSHATSKAQSCSVTIMSQNEEQNPYDLLGLPLEATEAQIRTAYRVKSLKVHPDRVGILFNHTELISILLNELT